MDIYWRVCYNLCHKYIIYIYIYRVLNGADTIIPVPDPSPLRVRKSSSIPDPLPAKAGIPRSVRVGSPRVTRIPRPVCIPSSKDAYKKEKCPQHLSFTLDLIPPLIYILNERNPKLIIIKLIANG